MISTSSMKNNNKVNIDATHNINRNGYIIVWNSYITSELLKITHCENVIAVCNNITSTNTFCINIDQPYIIYFNRTSKQVSKYKCTCMALCKVLLLALIYIKHEMVILYILKPLLYL